MADRNNSNNAERNEAYLFFQRLTKLFRSGPSIRRKIRGYDEKNYFDKKMVQSNLGYFGGMAFKRESSPFSIMGMYGILDRMSRYCLAGETKVAITGPEGSISIKKLVERFKNGEEFFVFSFDTEKQKVITSPVKRAEQTKVSTLLEVILDTGDSVFCTKDHPWMLRDGSYKEAQFLEPSDALMPFKRANINGYRYVKHNEKEMKPEHVLVMEAIAKTEILKKDKIHVHHKNFVKTDNTRNNLVLLNEEEHLNYHLTLNQKIWGNPQHRQNMSNFMKVRWEDGGDLRNKQEENFVKRTRTKGYKKAIKNLLAYNKEVRPGKFNKNRQDQKQFENANADKKFTFQTICSAFEKGTSLEELAQKLGVSISKIRKRLSWQGYSTWKNFVKTYENHKVIAIKTTERFEPVYDIEVENNYHNFALCSSNTNKGLVFVHNCEFNEMEQMSEISTALDIYCDETCSGDAKGRVLHVYSDKPEIRHALEELFYEVLNADYDMRAWVRNLVKYGDLFLFCEVQPSLGVINAMPIPVNEIEREEGFDTEDPYAVRFKLLSRGGKYLQNWQIAHFRILSNDLFKPYGTSFIENCRRIFRQLCIRKNTPIWTTDGWKYIQDVHSGESVYSFDPMTKQNKVTKVKQIAEMGVQDIVSVKTAHRELFVTPNHGLLVKTKNGEYVYKKAEDIEINFDELILPIVEQNLKQLIALLNNLFDKTEVEWSRNKSGLTITTCNIKNLRNFRIFIQKMGIDFEIIPNSNDLSWTLKCRPNYYYWTHKTEIVTHITSCEKEQTYDLQIEDDLHNFVADGVVSHNTMLEDSMLTYRIVRSPERRVFYIDTSGVHPNDVPNYMEQVRQTLRSNLAVDRLTGRVDQRYNPPALDEDFFLPIRQGSLTKIENLQSNQNTTIVDDVKYLQSKLTAALKIPRAFLGFDDMLSSKATLASEDVRFSRTITNLQKIIISELNKIAIIHLYAKGFSGEDLVNFSLRLSNPSSLAEQQKLQLWATKFEIASKAKESGLTDEEWIQKEILGYRMDEIIKIRLGRQDDQIRNKILEALAVPTEVPEKDDITDPFNTANYRLPFGGVDKAGSTTSLTSGQPTPGERQEKSGSSASDKLASSVSKGAPINANPTPNLDRSKYNDSRHRKTGAYALSMPDFMKMLDMKTNQSLLDIYDEEFLSKPFKEDVDLVSDLEIIEDKPRIISERLPKTIVSALHQFEEAFRKGGIDLNKFVISEPAQKRRR